MQFFKRLSLVIAVSIMSCMLMVGCLKLVFPVNTANSTRTPNNDSEQEDIPYTPDDDSKRQDDLQSWAGAYGFSEYAPPDLYMWYRITIYNENGEYYADLFIDGHMANKRMKANVIGDSEDIDLVLDTYLPNNDFESIEEGEVLLRLKRENSEIHTYWGGIQPMIPGNSESGKIYFETEPLNIKVYDEDQYNAIKAEILNSDKKELREEDFKIVYKDVVIDKDTKPGDITSKLGFPEDYEDHENGFISGNDIYTRWILYYQDYDNEEIEIVFLSENAGDEIKDEYSYIVGVHLMGLSTNKGLTVGDELGKVLQLYGKPDSFEEAEMITGTLYTFKYFKDGVTLEVRLINDMKTVQHIFLDYNMQKSMDDQFGEDYNWIATIIMIAAFTS